MISIGQQYADALTQQFYRWELRGRGWMVWPDPVRLEPPFRRFEGHFVPNELVEDDGQIESLGSRFANRLGRLLAPSQPQAKALPPPLEEPEPTIRDGRWDLVELQIALPPDYQPHASVFEQFLFCIGNCRDSISFEVIGTAKELVVQIAVGPDDADAVRDQMRAFFPEAVVTPAEEYLPSAFAPCGSGYMNVMDFGLEREFMVPINGMKAMATDPLVSLCATLGRLNEGEACAFQVLIEPARNPWSPSILSAVSLSDGRPFFANDAELVAQARLKVSRPLYAVAVRAAAVAPEDHRMQALLKAVAGGLHPLANLQGNRLVPLTNEDYPFDQHVDDLLQRITHRSGMLLNSDELIALAHLPTAAVRTKTLKRANQRTKAPPAQLTGDTDDVIIGLNVHEGVSTLVRLPMEVRLNHCHILGGTGSGKSTILALTAMQDIQMGHGVAVIDPHGDLIDTLLPHVPPERLDDVILFDPSDEEYAIGFNPFAASSTREKELLASDFVSVMRQHTSSWGDQMSSLLGNAVLAFLHNSRTGTLPELRRFLFGGEFRSKILETVTNAEVAYFWEHESSLTNKSAIGSILVRLDELLRSEYLLHILGQRSNKLDFAGIMDSKKIFLARLSKGLIGQANAYLLGSLLVSKFYQTTIARQARRRELRAPYMLIMDEAGELLTSTISEILVGARKYGLGLTLAHQSLRQLTGDDDLYGAVTGSCGTKICFQVGGDDARKMAEEFAGFAATDLMNLPKLHAIARVGPRDASFNLQTEFLPEGDRSIEEAYADLIDRTRKRYGTPKADIRGELETLRGVLPKRPPSDPFAKLSAKQKAAREQRVADESLPEEPSSEGDTTTEPPATAGSQDRSAKRSITDEDPTPVAPLETAESSPPDSGSETVEPEPLTRGKAESVKNAIIQAAGGWGFTYETEKKINNGTGSVDIVLTLGSLVIACEISATTPADHEVENVLKCLRAGFQRIVHLCDVTHRRRRVTELVEKVCSPDERERVEFLTVKQFLTRLGELAEQHRPPSNTPEASAGKTVFDGGMTITREEREAALKKIAANMLRDQQKKR